MMSEVNMKRILAVPLLCALVLATPAHAQQATQAEREAMYEAYVNFASHVKGGSITPRWMADGSSFWYAEGTPEATTIWKVDPRENTRVPLKRRARSAPIGRPGPLRSASGRTSSIWTRTRSTTSAIRARIWHVIQGGSVVDREALLEADERGSP
ncbi:MAG: hypothetical protein WEA09_08720 [Gemmatimonadota bacterium]